MLVFLSVLSLLAALGLLAALSAIDLQRGILPNELVLAFFIAGLIFHGGTNFIYLDPLEMIIGGLSGGGILLALRAVANRVYQQDTLGLGDVKLMGAAGVWLGPYFVMIALCTGAMMGVAHGLIAAGLAWRKTKKKPDFSTLSIPAGPAFAIGIMMAGAAAFYTFPEIFYPNLFGSK